MNQYICQENLIHEDRVLAAQKKMPAQQTVTRIAAAYKLLGDPTRLRIMLALTTTEMCVCDLASLLESTPSAISHQLRLLRTARLVQARKDGKMVYYRLEENSVQKILYEGLRYIDNEQ
ncbi:MAG: transcriptional regulator [Deltaproteobacteria bacterium]|nr:MAG: transcriptional regulator [Deltaproteobacteria bacterium]